VKDESVYPGILVLDGNVPPEGKLSVSLLVLSAASILSLGRIVISEVGETLGRRLADKLRKRPTPESPAQRLQRLSEKLSTTSLEFDVQLRELEKFASARQQAVEALEATMKDQTAREQQLRDNIKMLENVPLPVAKYFSELASSGEKKSARRDYLLFAAGVVVSTAIAIVLHLSGLT
jgi:hypothetical protein